MTEGISIKDEVVKMGKQRIIGFGLFLLILLDIYFLLFKIDTIENGYLWIVSLWLSIFFILVVGTISLMMIFTGDNFMRWLK